ncbi:MAG: hypothetical protein HZB92_05605 [Euryarchaeota archaeon]|nr:hypothetical protein [Euryarchaeota archaeon]
MKLRKKTLVALGSALIIFIVILCGASNTIILNGFSEVEKRDTEMNVNRVVDALSNEIERINRSCADWAFWDDSYQFVEDGNLAYINSNLLGPSLVNLKINIMLLANASNQIVYTRAVDLAEEEVITFPQGLLDHLTANDLLLHHNNTVSSITGLINLPEGILMFSSLPILTSDGQGPIHGTFMMGRFLDSVEIDHIAKITHLDVSIYGYDEPQLPPDMQKAKDSLTDEKPAFVWPMNEEYVAGYTSLRDTYGNPAVLLRVEMSREIFKQGQVSISYFISGLLILSLAFLALSLLLLEKQVLSRISKVSKNVTDIGASGDITARLTVCGADELSNLTKDINLMLGKLEESRDALMRAKEGLELQVNQMRAISQALINDIGIERTTGLLYNSGWEAAINEAKPIIESGNKITKFDLEEVFKAHFSAMYEETVIDEFDVEKKMARITMTPPREGQSDIMTDPSGYYCMGFLAGLISLVLSESIGLTQKPIVKEGKVCYEFTTRALEPYEKSAYKLYAGVHNAL